MAEEFAPGARAGAVSQSLTTWANVAIAVISTSRQVYTQLTSITLRNLIDRSQPGIKAITLKSVLDDIDARMKKRVGNTQALRSALSKLASSTLAPAELLLEVQRQAASYANLAQHMRAVFTATSEAVAASREAEKIALLGSVKDAVGAVANAAKDAVGAVVPWWVWGIAGVAGVGVLLWVARPYVSLLSVSNSNPLSRHFHSIPLTPS